MDWQIWFAGALFLVVYGFIISEKIHRTVIALLVCYPAIPRNTLPSYINSTILSKDLPPINTRYTRSGAQVQDFPKSTRSWN
jgi:hypothetical protein